MLSFESEPITWADNEGNLVESYLVTCKLSAIEVTCCVSSIENDAHIDRIRNRALDLARARVESWAFLVGKGVGISLDYMVDENGKKHVLIGHIPGLVETVKCGVTEEEIYRLLSADQSLLMALNDLISGITFPYYAHVNCGRAIDAIRCIMAPDLSEKAGWKFMQESLKIEEPYLVSLSHLSREGRHGKRAWIDPSLTERAIFRAWEVMNRFLYFKTHGEITLDPAKFPLLKL
jgi:hypothetical protein